VSSATGFLAIDPFSFTAGGGTAGDEAAFSAGSGTELSEVGGSVVEKNAACFIVKDHEGKSLAYVYFEDEPGRRVR
jgi:hypothetical protein